ncbi:hypothetical protein [Acinetobacter sp. MD2(2019)]|uniref:hypothetical protein n=1 Tax=Acinetobacter sp. MD2(2019) TaxID=2605273 RepID=UPI002D1E60C7|nr:hypothetical protein [Acinetobacter sp. MD2(2019)]MEB3754888.1 hypothetical protein [Acinetobacter sp. MD2(2019)]
MKALFTELNGETVRLVVKLNNLSTGTLTYGDFQGFAHKAGSKLRNVQFVDEFNNNMGRDGNLELIKDIQVFDGEFKSVLKIIDVDFVEEAMTFVVEIQDKRIVQVQFDRNTNRLDANFNTHTAHIDKENDYDYDLNELEEALFTDWIRTCKQIQDVVDQLDAEYN